MSRRIWELDALRGLCILGMILVHLVYDIRELYGLADFAYPAIFSFVMQWGSVLFLLISGICVTLGHHPVRRGLAVFGCGMLCSLVTAGMYWLGFQGRGHSPLPGGMHASVAVAGAATQLGIGGSGPAPFGAGLLVPEPYGGRPLALSPGPDDGRICLQRLFPPAA